MADLHRWWYRELGSDANRMLVESFMQLSPRWVLATRTVPYWSLFPTESCLARLWKYLDASEPFDDIFVTLFNNGMHSIGMSTIDDWTAIRRLEKHGAEIVTTEMVLFEWIGSAEHPRFREILALVKLT